MIHSKIPGVHTKLNNQNKRDLSPDIDHLHTNMFQFSHFVNLSSGKGKTRLTTHAPPQRLVTQFLSTVLQVPHQVNEMYLPDNLSLSI